MRETADIVTDLEQAAAHRSQAREDIDRLIVEADEAGLPDRTVGDALGISSDGVRMRRRRIAARGGLTTEATG